ncbi:LysR family transcriptional regulator [Maritalea mobilis]|uniref:LysR substrate-binding domain-containing protein n=1 Tax=Maritalea mobilis TaxID=483324 RepID=UPI001C9713F5|nr:LysR substrate-binding domain-containing protein [Maritalea mobilis]MBY6199948.1 LysR family transcriptional regulator [Maritalea mobilis]
MMSVSPKRPKGPPLNAMRAFEAAARHVSFAAAAEELNVTAGAISQHIKTLEDWAGTPLFRRNAQGVALTSAGRALAADFTVAFDRLADATRALRNLKPNADFHIAALPSVAQLWLPRRLSRIRAQFPEISFSVTAMETPPSLSRELFDLSIFFATPDESPGQRVICPDEIVPVCAPDLLARAGKPLEFSHLPLLHDQTWQEDWHLWSQEAGVPLGDDQKGARFSLYSLAVEEAKAGAGLLIGHLCLLEDALASGALVKAHGRSCRTGRALVVQAPRSARRRPETDRVITLLSD